MFGPQKAVSPPWECKDISSPPPPPPYQCLLI